PHRDPVHAHPARGLDGMQRRHHHQQRRYRRPGSHRHPGRAVLPHGAGPRADRRAVPGRARGASPPGRRSRRARRRPPGWRGDLRRRIRPRSRRARRDLPARRPAEVGAAGAAACRHDARGGLHPHRRRRGDGGRRSAGGGADPGGRRGDAGRGGHGVKIWPIYKKEMRLYFTSPIAWVILTIFLFIAGYFFYSIFAFFTLASMQSAMNPAMARDLNVTDSVLRPLFSNISVILLLLMPLVTMRLFAEERRSGTIELLLTYPVRDGAVLAGKYLAAFALYAIMIALTLLYPGIVVYFARLEWGPVLTGYLGLLLMGGMFIAVGVCASSLTENQIVAAITTFGVLLLLWVLGWSADYAGGTAGRVLQHLSLLEHNDSFAKGVLDTKDIIYYANFIVLALFLTLRSLEARRWNG